MDEIERQLRELLTDITGADRAAVIVSLREIQARKLDGVARMMESLGMKYEAIQVQSEAKVIHAEFNALCEAMGL